MGHAMSMRRTASIRQHGSMSALDAANEAVVSGIPDTHGVNAGSLEDSLAARDDLTQAEAGARRGLLAEYFDRFRTSSSPPRHMT